MIRMMRELLDVGPGPALIAIAIATVAIAIAIATVQYIGERE